MVMRRNKSGFTMVELLVVLAVSSILMTLMYQVYRSQLKTHTTQQKLVEMQQNTRAALYLMERDIRMAGYAPIGGVADPVITTSDADTIQFAMDIRGAGTFDPSDGDTADYGEQVQYSIDGSGNLVRTINNGAGGWITASLLNSVDIDSLRFFYMDATGAETLDPSAIRSVEISIDASIGTTAMVEPHEMQLRSEVNLRNLGLVP